MIDCNRKAMIKAARNIDYVIRKWWKQNRGRFLYKEAFELFIFTVVTLLAR